MKTMKKILVLENPEKHYAYPGTSIIADKVKIVAEASGWETISVYYVPYADIRLERGDISLVIVHQELDMDISELRKNHPQIKCAGYSAAVCETGDREIYEYFRKQYDFVLETIIEGLPPILKSLEEELGRQT